MAAPRAFRVVPAAEIGSDVVEHVTLDFNDRHRRRLRMTSNEGREFVLDLAEATALVDGDGLCLDDNSIVRVHASDEPVAVITAQDRETLVRIAWHLGNRHLPTQVDGERLIIRDDHVIVDMVRGLGGQVQQTSTAFQPEGGAYSGGHGHDH